MRRALCVIGATLAATATAVPAALAGRAARSSSHLVTIKNFAFHASKVDINVGDTETCKWEDSPTPHNVTSTGGHFRSSPTKTTGTFTVRFSKAGTFKYSCTIHPFMLGEITVRK